MITITKNTEHNGIELGFDSKPTAAVIASLKEQGFRWHRVKKVWYARVTKARETFANELAGGKTSASSKSKPKAKKEKANKFELTIENLCSCLDLAGWREGKISEYACVSKGCKKFLKLAGINSKVYSQSFSGGDSVTVTTQDVLPSIEQKLHEIFQIFEAGHFDGMTDCYEYYRNRPEGIPTTKYFFYQNEWTPELKERLRQEAIKEYGEDIVNRDSYETNRIYREIYEKL